MIYSKLVNAISRYQCARNLKDITPPENSPIYFDLSGNLDRKAFNIKDKGLERIWYNCIYWFILLLNLVISVLTNVHCCLDICYSEQMFTLQLTPETKNVPFFFVLKRVLKRSNCLQKN